METLNHPVNKHDTVMLSTTATVTSWTFNHMSPTAHILCGALLVFPRGSNRNLLVAWTWSCRPPQFMLQLPVLLKHDGRKWCFLQSYTMYNNRSRATERTHCDMFTSKRWFMVSCYNDVLWAGTSEHGRLQALHTGELRRVWYMETKSMIVLFKGEKMSQSAAQVWQQWCHTCSLLHLVQTKGK